MCVQLVRLSCGKEGLVWSLLQCHMYCRLYIIKLNVIVLMTHDKMFCQTLKVT